MAMASTAKKKVHVVDKTLPKGAGAKSLFSGKFANPNLELKLAEIAESIEAVQAAAQKIDQSELTRDAVVLLIQHAAGTKAGSKLTQKQVNAVLDTMLELDVFLKKDTLPGVKGTGASK